MNIFNIFKNNIIKKEDDYNILINGYLRIDKSLDDIITGSDKNLFVDKYGVLICKDINIKRGYINGVVQANIKVSEILYLGDDCKILGEVHADPDKIIYLGEKEAKIMSLQNKK